MAKEFFLLLKGNQNRHEKFKCHPILHYVIKTYTPDTFEFLKTKIA